MRFRIGDAFDFSGSAVVIINGAPVKNFTNWIITSQIRDTKGNLIATLTATWLSTSTGALRIRFIGDTSEWPEGRAFMDIRFTDPAGNRVSTDVLQINLFKGVTS